MTSSRARVSEQYKYAERPSQRNTRRSPAPQRNVKNLPRRASVPLPGWLQFLIAIQKISITSTVLLTVSVFGIYAWTVYAQESWNNQHKKLEQLQRQERQLTAAEAFIGNDLVKKFQTQPGELVRESPERSIFLESAPTRPNRAPIPTSVDTDNTKTPAPVGY
ncbi:hypothetical protein V2H45_24140 [Tumidithrix elongata RA019]|uniref:Cell division protein FtsL n=1 Tax=Tumidithrix elongata BACA0141 TaxID=2716417 RepID=A0AAW9Q9G0_9CYAN|nr:hypothetical protein [Tumidithrix elongata RA019]